MEQEISPWLFWILLMVTFALFLFLRQRRGKREDRFKQWLKKVDLQSPLCFRDFLTMKAWLKLSIKKEGEGITISFFPYLFFCYLLFGAIFFVLLSLWAWIEFPEELEFIIIFMTIFFPISGYLHYKTIKKAIYDLRAEI